MATPVSSTAPNPVSSTAPKIPIKNEIDKLDLLPMVNKEDLVDLAPFIAAQVLKLQSAIQHGINSGKMVVVKRADIMKTKVNKS